MTVSILPPKFVQIMLEQPEDTWTNNPGLEQRKDCAVLYVRHKLEEIGIYDSLFEFGDKQEHVICNLNDSSATMAEAHRKIKNYLGVE